MEKPTLHAGLRHIALFIKHFDEAAHFYTELLGFKIVWQPDPDNLYLSSGSDNIALHRAPADFAPAKHQHLDHFGFLLKTPEEVDLWHTYLVSQGVKIVAAPKDHRDGTRSFYCKDPDGNTIQMIYMDI